MRFADACIPLSGERTVGEERDGALVNLPASMFLYPWSAGRRTLLAMHLHRLKQGMTSAARTGGIFHLWWHPHNFGVNLEENLASLKVVVQHYRVLAETYGMQSQCMGDFAVPAAALPCAASPRSSSSQAKAAAHSLQGNPE